MQHELFRYLLPGVSFLSPVYVAICWRVLTMTTLGGSSTPVKAAYMTAGAGVLAALAVPVGLILYSATRALRHVLFRDYENSPFVKRAREAVDVVFQPADTFYVRVTPGRSAKGGSSRRWMQFSRSGFDCVFNPFWSWRMQYERVADGGFRADRLQPQITFAEHVSDLYLWEHPSYDYARSLSSLRYGIDSGVVAAVLGVAMAGLVSLASKGWFQTTPDVSWNWPMGAMLAIVAGIAILVAVRRFQLAAEYNARLLLITHSELDEASYEDAANAIDSAELRRIIETIAARPEAGERGVALLDLDGTLVRGDVSDAVLADLTRLRHLPAGTWSTYIGVQEQDARSAFESAARSIESVAPAIVAATVRAIMDGSRGDEIPADGHLVPVPAVDRDMQAFVAALRLLGVNVHVVSATATVPAQIVSWDHFGIPAGCVHAGFDVETGRLVYGEQKIDSLARQHLGTVLCSASDSMSDVPILAAVGPDGFAVWRGAPALTKQVASNIQAARRQRGIASEAEVVPFPFEAAHTV